MKLSEILRMKGNNSACKIFKESRMHFLIKKCIEFRKHEAYVFVKGRRRVILLKVKWLIVRSRGQRKPKCI